MQPHEFCSAAFPVHGSPRPVARNPTIRLALLPRRVLLEGLFNMSRLLQREWRSEVTHHFSNVSNVRGLSYIDNSLFDMENWFQ